MEIHSLYGVSQTTPIDPATKSREDVDAQQAMIAAVRALNKSELPGQRARIEVHPRQPDAENGHPNCGQERRRSGPDPSRTSPSDYGEFGKPVNK